MEGYVSGTGVVNWNCRYDDFNRLCASNQAGQSSLSCSSSNNTGTQAYLYVYDRFGNRWQQNVTAGTGNMSSLGFDANNRITSGSGVTYDAAGNVTSDGTHAYTFDAENRITQVDAGSTASYVYNASGERIRKTTASGSVDYLYDLAGNSITELSSSGGWNRGEVYAGGKHLATYSGGTSGNTFFIHADWLGTERARSTAAGAGCETVIGLPFGDGQAITSTCTPQDPSPMHFTGKQRDPETASSTGAGDGLDDFGARYFNSRMARWLTPDWSAKPTAVPHATLPDPQSLNLYAYVRNNPISATDPDGHGFWSKLWNVFVYGSFDETENIIERERNLLIDRNVIGIDKNGYGVPIDWSKASNKQVDDAFRSIRNQEILGTLESALRITGPAVASALIPGHVTNTLRSIDKTGSAPQGQQGGAEFQNREARLPQTDSNGKQITYREWDVNPKQAGVNRGTERHVTGSDGSANYTNDH